MTALTDAQIAAFVAVFPAAKRDEPMAVHTYLKIGGPARLYVVVTTADELVKAVETAKANAIPWYVFGGGSNLLVSDDGYQGVVIQAGLRGMSVQGAKVTAQAGDFTGAVARAAVEAGLTGFEWGVGVPGTMGGAVYGNAGCFGGEMKDVVETVDAFDVTKGARVSLTNAECGFGYRDSRFKREPHLILGATLVLVPGDATVAKAKLDGIMSKRKDTQPQGAFSAGCLFKNYDFKDESELDILRREDEVPADMLAVKRIGAGWLIDKLGLKGKAIGKAQISPVHGNFLVNQGGARAQDVLALSSYVKMKVRDELGILLEDEVQYLGF
jgi:UDP-N-acetylmuramate dehydrogenase